MVKSRNEIIRNWIYCNNLERNVLITRIYLVHPTGFRAQIEFDCKSVH
jgi:hypothetical protein